MRNRISLRILGLLLVGLALAAVNVSAGGEEEAAATGPITIGLLNAKGMAWANNEDLMASQAEEYNRIHGTEIAVESSLVPFESLHEKALTDFVSGTGSFDMISVLGDWLAEFIRGEFLEPLDDYLEAKPPDGYPEQFPPALMWMQTGPDGRVYGLPFHDGPIMFYYRKDLIAGSRQPGRVQGSLRLRPGRAQDLGAVPRPRRVLHHRGQLRHHPRRQAGRPAASLRLHDPALQPRREDVRRRVAPGVQRRGRSRRHGVLRRPAQRQHGGRSRLHHLGRGRQARPGAGRPHRGGVGLDPRRDAVAARGSVQGGRPVGLDHHAGGGRGHDPLHHGRLLGVVDRFGEPPQAAGVRLHPLAGEQATTTR